MRHRPYLPALPFQSASLALLFHACAVGAASQDAAGIEKALDGLPPEVRSSVRLVPEDPGLPIATAADPLPLALRLSMQISGDDDLRNRLLHQCGRQALAQGSLETARSIAARITDYRAALLLLDLCEHAAESGDAARARQLLDLAAGMTQLVKPWQAELILARLVYACALLELDAAMTTAWWDAIKDPEARLDAGARLMALESARTGVFDLPRLRAEQSRHGRAKPLPGLHETSRRLFAQALSRLEAEDARQRQVGTGLVDAACEVLALSHVARAALLVETAADFLKAGREDISKRLFQIAEKNLGAPHEEHMRLIYLITRLWHLRGDAGRMTALVDGGEERLRQMEPMYLPYGLAWLAAAHELAGQSEKAASMLEEAALAALENPNRRTGLAGAVEICLCHARTGRPLPENVYKKLAEMAGLPGAAGE